jgi:hypothetical protein
VLSAITVAPKPNPSAAVATRRTAKAASGAPMSRRLSASSVMETILPANPANSTRRKLDRRASFGANAEARMANATCGTNIVP